MRMGAGFSPGGSSTYCENTSGLRLRGPGSKDLDQACEVTRAGDLDARTLLDTGPGTIFVDGGSIGRIVFAIAWPVALHFEGTLVLPGKGKSVASLIDASE